MNKGHTLFTDLWGRRWGWTAVGRGRCWFQQERGAGQHHKHSISGPGPSPPLCIGTWHSGHPHTFMADTVHLLTSSSSKHLLSYFWKGRGGRKNSVPSNKLSKKKKKNPLNPTSKWNNCQSFDGGLSKTHRNDTRLFLDRSVQNTQRSTNPIDTCLVFWNINLKNNQKNKCWYYWYCLSIITPVLHDTNS